MDYNQMNEDSSDSLFVLTAEDGTEETFELLDIVELSGQKYAVLLPLEESDVVIFRLEGEEDEQSFVGVDDEAEAEAVFKLFKALNRDNFDFED